MMALDGFNRSTTPTPYDPGDYVLKAISGCLVTGVRSTDFLVRYGGDEFTLILANRIRLPTRLVMDQS